MTTYDTRTETDQDRDELREEAPRGYEGNHVADGEVVDVDAVPERPEARGDEPIVDLEERDGVYVPTDSAATDDATEDDRADDSDGTTQPRGEFRPETDEAAPLSEHLEDEPESEPEPAEQTLSDAEVAAAAAAQTEPQERPDDVAVGVAAVPTAAGAEQPAPATLWADGKTDELRDRWEALQLRFVDDPAGITSELRDLVEEALQTMQQELSRRHDELDSLVQGADGDTEQLRQAVQRYRDFYHALLAH
ncbi:hypothetical protein QEZ54_02505 [Catellatospora sp. KI3]|uniref:hypothetical protein n=1 Tax=Catellatospora sp. KI3 TaxID=3041620 RepID=UPI0024826A90|nr:hypothetical protein [Catellatospora sp. KI3]MDI1459829.1 hypothetical protein [Catellatospora sp. KI3]